jgi:tryptophan synthase alpha chain
VRLTAYLRNRLKERRILLMTHLIAGYPSLEANWRMLEIMAEAGVDLVELQMPFSEPVADGPTFAGANQKALEKGLKQEQYFGLMRRATGKFAFPCLFMGYYNAAFRLGHAGFCARLKESGAAGFILPDLPVEEYGDLFALSEEHGLCPVLLMAPTNKQDRLQKIGRQARGLVYGVARRGVTGRKTDVDREVYAFIDRCRKATDLPLGIGFGLRSGEDVRQLQGRAEIAIVGSVLLETWEKGGEKAYAELLRDLSGGRD